LELGLQLPNLLGDEHGASPLSGKSRNQFEFSPSSIFIYRRKQMKTIFGALALGAIIFILIHLIVG